VDEWKPLHLSTTWLDVSTGCGICPVVSVTRTAQVVEEWKPLHWSNFRLDMPTFDGIGWVVSVTKTVRFSREADELKPLPLGARHERRVRHNALVHFFKALREHLLWDMFSGFSVENGSG